LAWFVSQPVSAGEIYVIVNPGLAVSEGDVAEIYTGDKQFAGSVKIQPVDNASLQKDFLAKVLQLSADKYNGLWTKKSFREGLTPPVMKSSDIEVTAFVRDNPGAIGYVSTQPPGVKVIRKF
jgi:hypothetical protein